MVGMTMGQDDQINFFWRDPVSVHLTKEVGDVAGMAWIDENRYFSTNQISITVVFVGILPKVGKKVFFKFHPSELLLTFATSGNSHFTLIKRWTMVLSNKKLKFRSP
jgi:hypothetical protein